MSQDFIRYVYLMSHRPGGRGTPELVKGHIAHLRRLDEQGRLVMCGPFKDYKGGMVVVKAESLDAARQMGYARIRLDTLPEMQAAQRLYESLSFYEIPPYYENPIPGKRCLEAVLS